MTFTHAWNESVCKDRPEMAPVTIRLPERMITILRKQAEDERVTLSHILAEGIVLGYPNLPWGSAESLPRGPRNRRGKGLDGHATRLLSKEKEGEPPHAAPGDRIAGDR